MEREYWTSGDILGVILQKEMTARTPKECRQVLSVKGGRLRSRMFDFLHQGCWQEHKESKIEVTEARLIRPVTERTQEPHQQQRGQEGEVRDRDGRERFRRAHVAAVWRRRREKAFREREEGEVKNVQDVPKRQSAVVGPHVSTPQLRRARWSTDPKKCGHSRGRKTSWTTGGLEVQKKCCSTVGGATAVTAFEQDAASPKARRKPVVHWDDTQQKMESSLKEGR